MSNDHLKKYGNGVNPPYSLYQAPDGRWGLVDGIGNRLEAGFKRADDRFSCVPWEVVTFDEQEGFELLAWYDPCETWFNFTYDNPDYPPQYGKFMWEACDHRLKDYADFILAILPEDAHWLIRLMMEFEQMEEDDKFNADDDDPIECYTKICQVKYPELQNPAKLNPLLEPVMSNQEIDIEIRRALWQSKVLFDSYFTDQY